MIQTLVAKFRAAVQTTSVRSWALYSAVGVLLFQMMNVKQVGNPTFTLFGATSDGIWVSTPELFLLVIVAFVLSEGAALGIILTSLALSFAVQSPHLIAATIGSKVVALVAVWAARRFGAGILTASLVALEIDVFAFAVWANLHSIIVPSLLIRLALWAAVAASVQVALVRKVARRG